MEITLEVKRVLVRSDGVKMVILPKNSKFEKGELVIITNDVQLLDKLRKEGKI